MARLGLALIATVVALAAGGCEIVADFDRSRIPEPAPDGGSMTPDGGAPVDSGPGPDEDAGDEDGGG